MAQRVIVVLGGGGVKGMTHVGAWKAIREAGLEVAEIVGTSIGALVGACLAGGETWGTLTPRARSLEKQDIARLNRWVVLLNGIRQPSVFVAEPLQEYIASVLPVKRFEDLQIPVSMNAVHLATGREEWFGAGGRLDIPLAEAVYASCALPLFYPPAEIAGKLYVDGGVADTLPVQRAAERGADLIVAVDAGAGPLRDARDTLSRGLVAVHHRVVDIMAYTRKRAMLESWAGPELVYVRPDLDAYSTFDFTHTEHFLAAGFDAARAALAAREGAPSLPPPGVEKAG